MLGPGWADEVVTTANDEFDLKLPATQTQLDELATELVELYRDWSA